MAGYVNQSPVKQVWLPIDHDFLNEHTGVSFGDFSKAYLKEYGIELHDIFELVHGEHYFVRVKICASIGGYNPALSKTATNLNDQGFAMNNVIQDLSGYEQSSNPRNLLLILLGLKEVFGYGFVFVLPTESTAVNSIDDLIIESYEI